MSPLTRIKLGKKGGTARGWTEMIDYAVILFTGLFVNTVKMSKNRILNESHRVLCALAIAVTLKVN